MENNNNTTQTIEELYKEYRQSVKKYNSIKTFINFSELITIGVPFFIDHFYPSLMYCFIYNFLILFGFFVVIYEMFFFRPPEIKRLKSLEKKI